MCLFDVLGLKLLVLTHTVTVFSTSVSSGQTSCSKDWFGPTCQYQCHCAGSAPCDKHDGSCSSGCNQDWFGPACQYARMGFTVNGNFNSSWLTDNNDTTCNSENLRSVTVTLDTPIPLTWLRVVVSDAVDFNTVKISYRSKSSNTQCPESNFVEINKVTADFSCPTEYPVTNVTLSGLGNSLLCSLYINAGRNVALKQRAEQSSLYENQNTHKDVFVAQNAVDGLIPNNSKSSNQLTCTHTIPGKRSWWQVSFTNYAEITRFVIENRQDCCQWRLNNFSLTVFPPNGSNTSQTFRDPGRDQTRYTIVPSPRISFPVKHVNITEGFNTERILTLCEVFIFGEIQCPANRYGLRCERECNCVNQTSCFVHSGGCPSGCAPGYSGLECSEECQSGNYGFKCLYTCSTTCGGKDNSCNQTDGTCTQGCDPGYSGRLCEDTCSATCGGRNNSCSQTDGACMQGCDPGYTGRFCQKMCPNGTYGVGCSQNCSITCGGPDSLCHHVDGNCSSGCDAGFKGEHCKQTTVQLGPIFAAAVTATIMCAVTGGVFMWRCRRRKAQANEEVENDISLCGVPSSRRDYVRQESSRTIVATPLRRDSNNGRASSSDPNQGLEDRKGNRVGDMERDRDEDGHYSDHRDTMVPVETLNSYIRQHATDSHFQEEFSSIPMVTSSPQTVGLSPQNVKKNRYKNIIPYDTTRVLLQRDEKKNQSDYINASYVKGYYASELFIASQAPSERTLTDFVRMIWEQRVDKVVMLTKLFEEGKKKCSMYWPVEGEEEFGDVSVRLLTTHVFAEYTIRNLRLSKSGEPAQGVTQFNFTAWPDKSVPESPWGLVDFHQRVMAVPGSGPVLVHCSAGVGRTGTFIGLCNLLQEAEATGKMDFRSVLWKLRQDRMHTIQTAEQYAFLHKIALVGHMTTGTTIRVKDIYPRLATLESCKEGATPSASYRREFEALLETCDTTSVKIKRSMEEPAESVYQNMSSVTPNRNKDRLSNILPNERYRAELRAETHHDDTYINAVFVPKMRRK